jgi:hypothetical protein
MTEPMHKDMRVILQNIKCSAKKDAEKREHERIRGLFDDTRRHLYHIHSNVSRERFWVSFLFPPPRCSAHLRVPDAYGILPCHACPDLHLCHIKRELQPLSGVRMLVCIYM